MKTKTLTTKQLGEARVMQLNCLPIMQSNKVMACKPFYFYNSLETFCDFYNKSSKKRIQVNTSELFANADFQANKEMYLQSLINLIK